MEDAAGRGDPQDLGASGSGMGGEAAGEGNTTSLAQGATPATTALTRAAKIEAFIANPMMPGPHQIILEHITFLIAIVLGGDVQEAAIQLLMHAQTSEQTSKIWAE